MKKISKIIGLYLLVPVTIFLLCAGYGLADNEDENQEVPFDEFYVYYENEDNKVVKADYVKAIEAATGEVPRDETLYLGIVDGVRSALANVRDVWVKVKEDDETKEIDYGKAFDDNLKLTDIIKEWEENGKYKEDYEKDIPEPDLVLAIKDGEARELPYKDQPWVDEVKVIYSDFLNEWCVEVIFDFDEYPFDEDGYDIESWDDFDLEKDSNNIHIKGRFIGVVKDDENNDQDNGEERSRRIREDEIIEKAASGDNRLRVFIKDKDYFTSDVEEVKLVVGKRDIKVTIAGTEYSYYDGVE